MESMQGHYFLRSLCSLFTYFIMYISMKEKRSESLWRKPWFAASIAQLTSFFITSRFFLFQVQCMCKVHVCSTKMTKVHAHLPLQMDMQLQIHFCRCWNGSRFAVITTDNIEITKLLQPHSWFQQRQKLTSWWGEKFEAANMFAMTKLPPPPSPILHLLLLFSFAATKWLCRKSGLHRMNPNLSPSIAHYRISGSVFVTSYCCHKESWSDNFTSEAVLQQQNQTLTTVYTQPR